MFKKLLSVTMVSAILLTTACSKDQAPELTEEQQKQRLTSAPPDTGSKTTTTVAESKQASEEMQTVEQQNQQIDWSALATYVSNIAYRLWKMVLWKPEISSAVASTLGLDPAATCIQFSYMLYKGDYVVDMGANSCPIASRVIKPADLFSTFSYKRMESDHQGSIYELYLDGTAVGAVSRDVYLGFISVPGELLNLCDGFYAQACTIVKENGYFKGVELKN